MSDEKGPGVFQRLSSWRLYPRAHENRVPISHPSIQVSRRAFFKAAGRTLILLQILFLALFAYIFGSLFQQAQHTHNLHVLYVDYDGGIIGTAIREAYKNLEGAAFPTLVERPGSDFTTAQLREEVCHTSYWAVLYTSPGASDRVAAALAGQSTTYNKNDVMYYIWNEARYSAVIDSAISANLQTLASAARIGYAAHNWTDTIKTPSTASLSVVADPWHLTSINIQPTTQGSRLIYNTLVIILILIQEFFYLGAINGLYEAFRIYSRLNPHRIIAFRAFLSLTYTMLGSLCTAGAIWAFRAGWQVNGNQFVLTWLILWLFAHVNFLTLDVFTVWIPPPYVPMALIAWIVFNVTSILLPFELSPAFYRWAYVMPAHEVYITLIDIWSGGCSPNLHYSLPILFSMEISSFFLSALGVHRRCHYAVIKEELDSAEFKIRLDTALAFERKKRAEGRKARELSAVSRTSSEILSADEAREEADDEKDREELSDVIQKETSEIRRIQTKASKSINFGPSFGFHMGGDDD